MSAHICLTVSHHHSHPQSAVFDSQPKSTVGTPAYIAPEVLSRKQYDGEIADVWSCGVTLYVMLVGAYPFEDSTDPRNFRKTIQRIMNVKYKFPDNLHLSRECLDIISRIFVANPGERITIAQIKQHPWFLRNLPDELRVRLLLDGFVYDVYCVHRVCECLHRCVYFHFSAPHKCFSAASASENA